MFLGDFSGGGALEKTCKNQDIVRLWAFSPRSWVLALISWALAPRSRALAPCSRALIVFFSSVLLGFSSVFLTTHFSVSLKVEQSGGL